MMKDVETTVDFEGAVRNKARFPFKGMITVEQLWDLGLKDLDEVFKNLNKLNKQAEEESLLDTKTAEQKEVSEKIDIVKYIVKVKQAEASKLKNDLEDRKLMHKVVEALAKKDEEEFEGKTKEELEAILRNLTDKKNSK